MRMSLVAATALAGSLLIPLLMLGSAQAVTNAPVLKSVVSTNPDGPVTLGHFHNRRFVNNAFFVGFPGWWGYGSGSGCYWLRRQAIVTGSPYWWSRYQACVGYY